MTRLPETMMAIEITKPGAPEVLRPVVAPCPAPGKGAVLVRVQAAGVNRPDVLQRIGAYPPPPGAPAGPGLEIAGTIVAAGADAKAHSIGDRVCALVAGAGYAAYCVVDERHCLPVPDGLSMIEAAGLCETGFTVWHNVFERGQLQPGETLLIHGGSSGIGTMAIQIAKAWGARVIVTAGSEEKCQACRALGADLAINYRTEDFVAVIKEADMSPNVILDMVGGDYIARNYAAAAPDGRIVQIAFLGGAKPQTDFTRLMIKRLTHTGSTLRPQSADAKARIARGLLDNVWPLIAKGHVKPVIHATFALEDAPKAHTLMETSSHIGKIILTVQHGA